MKKWIPLLLALVACMVFGSIIFKNERHLQQGKSIFIALEPVDPRSLIQGDYMVLNYDLKLTPEFYEQEKSQPLAHTILSYIQIDEKNVVISTALNPKTTGHTLKLKLKNPRNRASDLYPAANSYLFAEGLATCYNAARFAEFKVDDDGNPLLANLLGENLVQLNCEQQRKWYAGAL